MAIRRCRLCRTVLEGDLEEIGARCPHCRRPLYERSEVDDGIPLAELVDRDLCAVHPESTALAPCPRCGNFFCDVCRTRWQGRWLCISCVQRALAGGGTAREEAHTHRRQALLSALLGGLAWIAAIFGVALILASVSGDNAEFVILGVLLILGGSGSATLGLAQGAAAIRARGDRLLLATAGLLLSGLYTGMVIGVIAVSLWQE